MNVAPCVNVNVGVCVIVNVAVCVGVNIVGVKVCVLVGVGVDVKIMGKSSLYISISSNTLIPMTFIPINTTDL